MLWDLAGVLVGFITIILLLSLIVTGLVQAAISLTRARYLNLRRGVDVVLINWTKSNKGAPPLDASEVLRAFHSRFSPNNWEKLNLSNPFPWLWQGIKAGLDWLVTPSPTWMTPEELGQALSELSSPPSFSAIKEIQSNFEAIEKFMEKRFAMIARLISIACAFFIAFIFQVSAPEVLTKLSADPQTREAWAAVGAELSQSEDIASQASEMKIADASLAAVAAALQELAAKHADFKEQIDGVAKQKLSPSATYQTLKDALALAGADPAIAGEYAQNVATKLEDKAQDQIAHAQDAASRLAALGISIWPDPGYYKDKSIRKRIKRLLGVLMTGLLLTFGAPFWFEQLKNMVKLRDSLKAASAK